VDFIIISSHIKVVDKNRLTEKISKINKIIINEVENNLMFVLGIMRV